MPNITKNAAKGVYFRKSISAKVQAPYDFAALFSAVRRYQTSLFIWLLTCVTIAGIYVVLTPPEYTAYTQIVLETPKRPRLVLDADGDTVPMDSAQADSRIQVIKSERLLRFVFDTLRSGEKPNAVSASSKGVLSFFVDRGNTGAGADDTQTFLDFMDRVSARRIGLSYVLELSYRARTPSEAAHMVNSITSAYIRDLVISAPSDSEVMQRRIFTVSHDAELLMSAVKAGTIPKTPIIGIDARVIGSAIEPLHKSAPHTLLTIIFALLASVTTGAAFVLFMHNRDTKIRSQSRAKRLFGPDLIGIVNGIVGDRDVDKLIDALPLDSGNFRLGIASWHKTATTTSVAQRLADRLANNKAVALLTSSVSAIETCRSNVGMLSMFDIDAENEGFELPRAAEVEQLQAVSHVIIDLPPLDAFAVSATIGKICDGVVLIVEQDATREDDLTIALDTLEAASVRFLGFILHVPQPSAAGSRQLAWRALPAALASLRQYRRTIDLPRMDLRARPRIDLSQMNLRD